MNKAMKQRRRDKRKLRALAQEREEAGQEGQATHMHVVSHRDKRRRQANNNSSSSSGSSSNQAKKLTYKQKGQLMRARELRRVKERLATERRRLPIWFGREELVRQIRKHDSVVIIGETGSGKTTQLPQYLHAAGFTKDGKQIAVTQPRRVAAVTVAQRVADEMGVELGTTVGYSIRFEDMSTDDTRVKYVTDGMLLRESQLDPSLSKYSIVIIDEAHERSLHTDILFAIVKVSSISPL
eukprot:TRINITY_DN66178_c7_g1_i3.p1 TRINITY_DN66178_c7_g1~~TRINITY_DN66178_c7_g1_i3.p1  ORF type:complete len:239 (-),score=110.03 TRINITY_DN66178_c7_g1_i3:24-740(-)